MQPAEAASPAACFLLSVLLDLEYGVDLSFRYVGLPVFTLRGFTTQLNLIVCQPVRKCRDQSGIQRAGSCIRIAACLCSGGVGSDLGRDTGYPV
jgi:hypothetical protein